MLQDDQYDPNAYPLWQSDPVEEESEHIVGELIDQYSSYVYAAHENLHGAPHPGFDQQEVIYQLSRPFERDVLAVIQDAANDFKPIHADTDLVEYTALMAFLDSAVRASNPHYRIVQPDAEEVNSTCVRMTGLDDDIMFTYYTLTSNSSPSLRFTFGLSMEETMVSGYLLSNHHVIKTSYMETSHVLYCGLYAMTRKASECFELLKSGEPTLPYSPRVKNHLAADMVQVLHSKGMMILPCIPDHIEILNLRFQIMTDAKNLDLPFEFITAEEARQGNCCVFSTELADHKEFFYLRDYEDKKCYAISPHPIQTVRTLHRGFHVSPTTKIFPATIPAFSLLGSSEEALSKILARLQTIESKIANKVGNSNGQNRNRNNNRRNDGPIVNNRQKKENTYSRKDVDKYFKLQQEKFKHVGPDKIYTDSYKSDKTLMGEDYNAYLSKFPKSSKTILKKEALDKVVYSYLDKEPFKGSRITYNQMCYLIACDDFKGVLSSLGSGIKSIFNSPGVQSVMQHALSMGANTLSTLYPPVAPLVGVARDFVSDLVSSNTDNSISNTEDSRAMQTNKMTSYGMVGGLNNPYVPRGLASVHDVSIPYIVGLLAPTLGTNDAFPSISQPMMTVVSSYQFFSASVSAATTYFGMFCPVNYAFSGNNLTNSYANFFSFVDIIAPNTVPNTNQTGSVNFGDPSFPSLYDVGMINSMQLEITFNYPPLTSNATITYAVLDGGTDANDNTSVTQPNVVYLLAQTISKMPFAKQVDTNSIMSSNNGKLYLNWYNTSYDEDQFTLRTITSQTTNYVGMSGPVFNISNVSGTVSFTTKLTLNYSASPDPDSFKTLGCGRLPHTGPMTDKCLDIMRLSFPTMIYYDTPSCEKIGRALLSLKSCGADEVLHTIASVVDSIEGR